MSAIVIPKDLDYSTPLPSLPPGVITLDQNLSPINGSTFSCVQSGSQIIFDLPSRGYLVPDSLYIRYRGKTASVAACTIRGCPVYSPFQRLDILFGSQIVESILNYNQVQHMMVNCTNSIGMKYGLQSAYGYKSSSPCPTMEEMDSRLCTAIADDFSLTSVLPCLLSHAEKLVPLGMMPNVRVQLTLDSIANIFTPANANAIGAGSANGNVTEYPPVSVPTAFDISEVFLSYTMIDFGPDVDDTVRSQADKLIIKSQSFVNTSNIISPGAAGAIELVYSQRLASIKSMFFHCSSNGANGIFDAFEITSGGDIQFSVAGAYLPQRPIACGGSRTNILMELRKAIGSIYDKNNNFSINSIEFSKGIAAPLSSTALAPAKCYYGVNCEQLPRRTGSAVLLSGKSTQNSPVTVRLNIVTPIPGGITVNAALILNFDSIIEIDPANKSAVVRQ